MVGGDFLSRPSPSTGCSAWDCECISCKLYMKLFVPEFLCDRLCVMGACFKALNKFAPLLYEIVPRNRTGLFLDIVYDLSLSSICGCRTLNGGTFVRSSAAIRAVYIGLGKLDQQGVLVALFVGSRVWYLGMRLPVVWLMGIG